MHTTRENKRSLHNTLGLLESNLGSLNIYGASAFDDVIAVGAQIYPLLRKLSSLHIVLDGSVIVKSEQRYFLYSIADLFHGMGEESVLEELELELIGFEAITWGNLGRRLSLITFPSLKIFKSHSLPHSFITTFLCRQPKLTHLDIGGTICTFACSLRGLVGRGRLVSVSCAASCASNIIVGNPVEYVSIIDEARYFNDDSAFQSAIASLRGSEGNGLEHLRLTFHPTQKDILQLIAFAAPNVKILSLYEVHDTTDGRIRSRRPWNDFKKWASELGKLANLQCLELRTSSLVLPKNKYLPDLWFPKPRDSSRSPNKILLKHEDRIADIWRCYGWVLDKESLEYLRDEEEEGESSYDAFSPSSSSSDEE